jgi:hypothetical protein
VGFGKSAKRVWILLAKVGVAGSNPVSRSSKKPVKSMVSRLKQKSKISEIQFSTPFSTPFLW